MTRVKGEWAIKEEDVVPNEVNVVPKSLISNLYLIYELYNNIIQFINSLQYHLGLDILCLSPQMIL